MKKLPSVSYNTTRSYYEKSSSSRSVRCGRGRRKSVTGGARRSALKSTHAKQRESVKNAIKLRPEKVVNCLIEASARSQNLLPPRGRAVVLLLLVVVQ